MIKGGGGGGGCGYVVSNVQKKDATLYTGYVHDRGCACIFHRALTFCDRSIQTRCCAVNMNLENVCNDCCSTLTITHLTAQNPTVEVESTKKALGKGATIETISVGANCTI